MAFAAEKKRSGKTPHLPDISEMLSRLGRKRQEAIRPVLENPREYVLLSVRDLAKKLGKNAATALRIVQGMGFETFRDFQMYLHELTVANATPLQLLQSAGIHDSSVRGRVEGALDQDVKNIQALRHSLDFSKLLKLLEKIYSARRVVIIGGDQAASLVDFLHYNLLMIDIPSQACTGVGQIVHAVRTLNKRDLLIAISFGRGLRQTVEGLKQAHGKGAYCVGVTDTFLSPLTRFADDSFIVSIESPAYGGSYAAPMSFFNGLLIACAAYRSGRTLAILREAEREQRAGFRWYREQ